jgi:hypothetical protein
MVAQGGATDSQVGVWRSLEMSKQSFIQAKRQAQSWMPIANSVLQRKCEKCRKKKPALQGAEIHPGPDSVPPIMHEVLRTPGQPLDPATRAFMEPRFRHDFSQVRVHMDAKAAKSARAVNALAYTVGRDVVFGARQYSPRRNEGQHLLAHELTHVIQQSASPNVALREPIIGPIHDTYEREASSIAQEATNAADISRRLSRAQPTLQRAPDAPKQGEATKKKSEIKISPVTRTIPKSDAETQVPPALAPTGLPDKSPSGMGTATASASSKKEHEVEASVEGSAMEKTVKTNVEVAIPITPVGQGLLFGQPLVLGKEIKFGAEIGLQQGPLGLLYQQQAALNFSLNALSLELESAKSRVPGFKELGLSVGGEATIDQAAPFKRPELGISAGLGAEYRIGRTPLYLQGSIGYEVKIPSEGPATAAPTADFGFKIKLP